MATETLDDVTASAVREAVSAAASGRLGEAIGIGERALASGADPAPINAMIGTFHCRTGALEDGIRHLRIANAAKPDDPVIAFNLGAALGTIGQHEAVLEVASEQLAEADQTLRLQRLRAFSLQQLEDFPAAVAAYERLVAANPDDVEAWNNLGNSRRGTGDFDGAIAALRRAAELDPKAPPVRFNLASALFGAGKHDEAEAEFRSMAEEFPSDWRPMRELYLLHRTRGKEEEALAAIEEASRRDSANVELLLAVASQRLMVLDSAGAERAYRQVVELQPTNGLAHAGLAVILDVSNREDELPGLIADASRRGVEDSVLNFIRAYDHRRAKRFSEGMAALEQVPPELEGARRAHLYGQLSEGAGEYDKAWEAFERMNAIQRDDPSQPEARGAAYRQFVRSRIDSLTPEAASRWSDASGSGEHRSPAFLVGFPRSGTTLLDTFLMGHPRVDVLEEEPSILHANKIFTDFDELVTASDAEIEAARKEYFDFVATRVDLTSDKLLVDKNPLATNSLPLIRRIFPDARIIVALRHPCDVVLSCFATNFKLNDGMANFLSIESAAELYDLTFTHLERVRELLPMPIHTIRYEDLVADPEAELRRVVDFLGLEWDDNLVDHQKTARQRGRIKTASYAQVVEPIYSRSTGRWKNFRKHLEPVLPVLQPWIDKFGYQ